MASPGDAWPPARAAWSLALMLAAANMLAFFHRQIITLLAEPIKIEFALSDTAIALLIGLFFTASYVIAVMPIARLSDFGNRARIIAISVLVWSTLTSLCLLARSFTLLVLIRMGIGAAESGLPPAAASLLADHFTPRTLPQPMGLFMSGVYLGGGIAMLGGGWLAGTIAPAGTYEFDILGPVSGWQLILFIAGLPGIALGGLLLLCIEDPRHSRRNARAAKEPARQKIDLLLRRSPMHVGLIGGLVLMIFVGNACSAWIPTMFQRTHGWSAADVGLRYGVTIVVLGTLGAIGGGWLTSHLRRWRSNAHLAFMLGCFVALIPLSAAFPLMPDPHWALALIALMNLLAASTVGVGYALLQEVTPVGLRARITGTNTLAANIIGGGLGPLSVALLTDHGFADPARLPEAISAIAATGSVAACLLLWIGIRHLWQRQVRSCPSGD